MTTALETLKTHMAAGRWNAALSLAAGWARLGEHKQAITRGHAARVNPDFYRQIGKDPENVVADGIAALKARYGE